MWHIGRYQDYNYKVIMFHHVEIDGLVQERHNSVAKALEVFLAQSHRDEQLASVTFITA